MAQRQHKVVVSVYININTYTTNLLFIFVLKITLPSKHLKYQLGPLVINVTFLDCQRGQLSWGSAQKNIQIQIQNVFQKHIPSKCTQLKP